MKEVCTVVEEIIKTYVEGIELNDSRYEESLTELGMDSIAFVRVIVEIEERFKVEIPDEYLLLNEMDTVSKMAEIIQLLIEE